MNRARTQFIIATIAMICLGVATIAAVVGDVFFDRSSDLTLLLVGALTAVTGQATAYLFRLNGQAGNQ